MSTITRAANPSLLRPGLADVFGDWNIYPALWKNVYKVERSDKAVEYTLEMQGLGVGQIQQEGAGPSQGFMQQGYMTAFVNQYYSSTFTITRANVMDNLYQSLFPQQAMQLRNSLDTLKNINAMAIFNNAFDASSTVSDGEPLCSTTHPISTGFLSNTFTNGVGFTESAVEDAITIIRSWQNLAGLPINYQSIKCLVPQKQAFNAARIFKSQYQTGTANNDINAIVHDQYMPGGYLVNPYIQNGNYWFILTDCESFKYFLRENLDIDFITDVLTNNITVRALERYVFGCQNWRGVFGSQGS
jgi:hypothetical protein